MKKYVFALLFLAFSTMLLAQQTPRTEQLDAQKRRDTYVSRLGYDSVQFTILAPKDTLLTTLFSENGRVVREAWVDSTHVYDVFGQLREVLYISKLKMWLSYALSTLRYDFDGSISSRPYTTPTGELGYERFNRKNERTNSYHIIKTDPSVNYAIYADKDGRKFRTFKSERAYLAPDSIMIQNDTFFYENGQIFTVEQRRYTLKEFKPKGSYRKEYAKNGTLLADVLPDSVLLIPFKDNVDCYYGLKNQRGDTIFTPRFDNITELSTEFWKVEEGSKVLMLRKDGKLLSAVAMDDAAPMTRSKKLGKFDDTNAYYTISNSSFYGEKLIPTDYFSFKKDKKYGIIDAKGKQILPPQYAGEFIKYDSTAMYFEVLIKDSFPRKKGEGNHLVMDRQGNFLFNNHYKSVELTGLTPYFEFSKTVKRDTSRWHYVGLVDKSGKVLFEDIYTSIDLNRDNQLFWVSTGEETREWLTKGFKNLLYGLFDPEKRTWVLPCVYQRNLSVIENNEIVLTDTRTQKQGMVTPSGNIILPFIYDTILQAKQLDVWAVAQNGRYQLYDLQKQTLSTQTYQYLAPVRLYSRSLRYQYAYTHDIHFFIAQQNDKWGLINLDGKIVVPFTYDYAGNNESHGYIALVKDKQATLFSDWFFPLPDPDKNVKSDNRYSRPNLLSFNLQGNKTDKTFTVNTDNRVLYPPQYRVVLNSGQYYLLENDAKERLLLFMQSGESLPFPYDKQLVNVSERSFLGILQEKGKRGFEVVNLKTQEKYHTINSGGVAMNGQSGTYFVKTDTPVVNRKLKYMDLPSVSRDTFLVDDTNWQMFDSKGKPLTTNKFRYPINFIDGVGIGAVDDKFGVWRTDGATVAPPQYKNAHFVADYRRIVLYENRGLKNWLQLLEPKTGKTLIPSGRYDGISEFHGEYALVSLGDKIGLVDTNGREIIAPMSLEMDTYNLMDSLKEARVRFREQDPKNLRSASYQMPVIYVWGLKNALRSPDSLNLPNLLRNRVWHYLLATQVETTIQRADFRKIERAYSLKTYNEYQLYQDAYNRNDPTNGLSHLFVDSLHISFALTADSASKSIFKNYVRTKAGWQAKRLSDILNLNRDNIVQINDLLRGKLKKLEDKDIDCGESISFVERTQNTFLAHAKGISFCFVSGKKDLETFRPFHYVPVLLTWGELKAFLN